MKSRRMFAPRVETLDDRNLLSIQLTNGLLDVIGTTVTDQIRITLPTPDQIGVTIDDVATEFAARGYRTDRNEDMFYAWRR